MYLSTYTAEEISDYIIYLASLEEIGERNENEGINGAKLQKILFFAQAYYLAEMRDPLFMGDFEAWYTGPLLPSIYSKYKNNITHPLIQLEDTTNIKGKDKTKIKDVWSEFGKYTASHLIKITKKHSPWKDAWNARGSRTVIDKEEIQKYYTGLLD